MSLLPVSVLVQLKGETADLDYIQDAIDHFGMRLRLTGRDLMRLGGVVDRVFGRMWTTLLRTIGYSELWSMMMQDIQFAIGDVADVIAAALDPILSHLVDLIESLADWLERTPWALWLVGLFAVFVILGRVIGAILTSVGWINLFVGTLITAHKAALGFSDALKYIYIRFTEGEAAAAMYLASLKEMQGPMAVLISQHKAQISNLAAQHVALLKQRGRLLEIRNALLDQGLATSFAAKEWDAVNAALDQNMNALIKNRLKMDLLNNEVAELTSTQAGLTKTEKKGWKARLSSIGQGIKSNAKLLAITSAVATAGLGLILAWEPLQDLFETLRDALEAFLAPLEPVVNTIMDWIDANPNLAGGLTLVATAIGTVITGLIMLGKGSLIVSGLTKAAAALSGALTGVGTSTLGILGPIGLVIAAVLMIITYFGWWDDIANALGAAWNWLAGVMGSFASWLSSVFGPVFSWLGGVLSGLASGIASFFAPVWNALVGVLQSVWNVLSAIGNLFVQIGRLIEAILVVSIQGLISVLSSLWNNVLAPLGNFIKDVFAAAWNFLYTTIFKPIGDFLNATLIPVLKTLWDVLVTVGTWIRDVLVGILNTFKSALDAIAGVINTVAGWIGGLADAIRGLCFKHATPMAEEFTNALEAQVPAIASVNSRVQDLATSLSNLSSKEITIGVSGATTIPKLQAGGYVVTPGLAYLHAGETVVPAGYTSSRTEIINYNSFYISGEGLSPREIAEEVSRILAERR